MPRSKFFRVATEGATTDGRNIDRDWIIQAAKNFNLKKYAPRVWLEHLRSILPDNPGRAYGDVVALEAREVEDGKMALFAQIDPTNDLIELNKKRQKIFTSIEINPNFAGSGEAYLVGLAVTDSPASLGTEALKFSSQHKIFDNRKQSPENLFSEAVEFSLEFDADTDATKESKSLVELVKELFSSHRKDSSDIKNQVAQDVTKEFAESAELLVKGIADLEKNYKQMQEKINAIEAKLTGVENDFSSLSSKLHSEDTEPNHRPMATGGTTFLAQC